MADLDGFQNGDWTGDADFTGLRIMRKSPLLQEAWRYWTSLCDGPDLPRRAALDPAAMKLILGHAMILDQVRHGTVRVRLGGHVMRDLMGLDVRGLPIRAFFDLGDRTRAVDLIEQVFDTPATLEMDVISHGDEGVVTGRILVLPLLDAEGAVTKALTVMATDRVVSDVPRRFSLTDASLLPVSRSKPGVAPARRESDRSRPAEMATGMAETGTAFDSTPSPVPWLRVVK